MHDNESDPQPKRNLKIPIIIAAIICLSILVISASTVVVIDAGHRGVVLTWGKVDQIPLGEGIHTITPFAQKVEMMEVRTLAHDANATAASEDIQDAHTTITLNYKLDAGRVSELYQTVGNIEAINSKIIQPAVQESVKAVTAGYKATDLIVHREQVRSDIEKLLAGKLSPRGIIVESVYITQFSFSPEFSAAVEAKVTAEQNYLKEQNILKSVEVQAQQKAAQAQGEGQYIETISKTIRDNPEYLQWYSIARWDGKLPIYMGSNALPFIDLSKARQPT